MIKTEHYAVCDVCTERVGPFDNSREATEAMNSWFKVSKGVLTVQCHQLGCAKIALDDAEELFKHSKPILPSGLGIPGPGFAAARPKDVTGSIAGTYMERMAQGANTYADLWRGEPDINDPIPARVPPHETLLDPVAQKSQSGKHGEKEN